VNDLSREIGIAFCGEEFVEILGFRSIPAHTLLPK
jgi:hypothetical protein